MLVWSRTVHYIFLNHPQSRHTGSGNIFITTLEATINQWFRRLWALLDFLDVLEKFFFSICFSWSTVIHCFKNVSNFYHNIYLTLSNDLKDPQRVHSYLASCRCRRTASPRWGRSNRGRGYRNYSCSKGCHRPHLSSICHIRSRLYWQLSSLGCTSHGQSSYWDKS